MTNKNRNNISSNYHNNYNTKRNINLEKFKTNNFRKDSYCTSIEKKRKALGLQFKPDLEKELSIQNDQKAYRKNIISNLLKHKIIKVNKRDENSTSNMNMEGINDTPQRFRILKKLKIGIILLKIKQRQILILIMPKKVLIVIFKII